MGQARLRGTHAERLANPLGDEYKYYQQSRRFFRRAVVIHPAHNDPSSMRRIRAARPPKLRSRTRRTCPRHRRHSHIN